MWHDYIVVIRLLEANGVYKQMSIEELLEAHVNANKIIDYKGAENWLRHTVNILERSGIIEDETPGVTQVYKFTNRGLNIITKLQGLFDACI